MLTPGIVILNIPIINLKAINVPIRAINLVDLKIWWGYRGKRNLITECFFVFWKCFCISIYYKPLGVVGVNGDDGLESDKILSISSWRILLKAASSSSGWVKYIIT